MWKPPHFRACGVNSCCLIPDPRSTRGWHMIQPNCLYFSGGVTSLPFCLSLSNPCRCETIQSEVKKLTQITFGSVCMCVRVSLGKSKERDIQDSLHLHCRHSFFSAKRGLICKKAEMGECVWVRERDWVVLRANSYLKVLNSTKLYSTIQHLFNGTAKIKNWNVECCHPIDPHLFSKSAINYHLNVYRRPFWYSHASLFFNWTHRECPYAVKSLFSWRKKKQNKLCLVA